MEKYIELELNNFSLAQIAKSGQCFRMDENSDGSYRVIVLDKYLKASQEGNKVKFYCSMEEYKGFWENYFDLNTDYSKFIEAVDENDAFLMDAVKNGWGIRILKQDLWEMTVSFLISQQNNITRIKRCINNICEKYGRKKTAWDGTEYYSFPTAVALANLPEDALMECNLGYRSKYVVRTAKMIASGEYDLHSLWNLSYEDARAKLMELYGVGKKVADCICLFSLYHIEAFPRDTHINQVVAREYNNNFPFERYEGFAGIIQQYIFFNELK